MRALKCLVALTALLAASGPAQQVPVGSGSISETVAKLKPGEFVWAPEAAPAGPMLLMVNVKTQRAVLFRNGVPIAASTVSTGRPGYSTPTGIFTILQKRAEHYSSTYDNAPMPYMQRLTWRGVALHAGRLPGYPASHGCIRLPLDFAKQLFGVTKVGMTVVVTSVDAPPKIAPTPDLLLTGRSIDLKAAPVEWYPEKSPDGPVSIIVSATDRRAVVIRNGIIIGSAPVAVDGSVAGTWAYTLRDVDAHGQHWLRMTIGSADRAAAVARDEWKRFWAPSSFRRAIASIIQPGTTIVVTSDSLAAADAGSTTTVLEATPGAAPARD